MYNAACQNDILSSDTQKKHTQKAVDGKILIYIIIYTRRGSPVGSIPN